MKNNLPLIIGLFTMLVCACTFFSKSQSPSILPTTNRGLTNSNVETAVNALLTDFCLGGKAVVQGIQEIPQQNSAVADLKFENFQYPVTDMGELMKKKDFKPQPKPQSRNPTDPLPSMEQMFPARQVSFSGKGRGILKKYNDGRWVLTEVRWGEGLSSLGVTGSVNVSQ
jgi:hypothetical protein